MRSGAVWLAAPFALVLVLAVGTGCDDGKVGVFVDLKTNFVGGGEVTRVRTTLLPASGAGMTFEADTTVGYDDNLLSGLPIAEIEGVAPGSYIVRVALLDGGRQFIERNVRLEVRSTTAAVVLITRNCENVVCPGDGDAADRTECLGGECVSPACGPDDPEACGRPACENDAQCGAVADCARALCEDSVCLRAVVVGACAPSEWCDPDVGCRMREMSMPDAGVEGSCASDADCDDGFDCTADQCVGSLCQHAPDDTLCTEASGGACIEGFGCQYDGCTSASCAASSACEVAHCEGDTCVVESACGATEMCCAGACVAMGCDDGNACTDDACGGSGCTHTPNVAACDDGVFCNGTDTCAGGTCAAHTGNPCPGMSVCQESSGTCSGCATSADCPATITGPWGTCGGFADTCDETGTHARTVTSYACMGGTCVPSDRMESEACTRTTGGVSCGATTYGGWGACGGFSGPCGETGTRTRTRTDRVCAAGVCADQNSPDTGPCSRSTDGTSCGTSTYSGWGACGSFSNVCDESGTQTRDRTDYICASGACGSIVTPESQACARSTEGDSCRGACLDGTCSGGTCTGGGCTGGRICICFGYCGTPGTMCP